MIKGDNIVYKRDIHQLDHIVRSVYDSMLPIATAKGVTMNLRGCERSIKIRGDKERLSELFSHLITNAVKYTRRGGTVTITCTAPDKPILMRSTSSWKVVGWIKVTVADTGIGIAEDEQDKIFKRFYRADTSNAEVAGARLSLTILHAIVNALGGRIECESKPSKGSTFTVHLPVDP
ncbi:MAG: HAMP domain-containing histidine kinase [Deltaproteobacteria bacterium]|nr:HAMP domain-containing histidine kinase [Deltaproteobacteria bacterium]